ncbi:MAG: RraA family protein [Oscillospiraceae bacterium]|nr:RraA family protein [Oscillospiraceae bacterium]
MVNRELQEKMVKYIKMNRVSSTQVADCLAKTGAISGVKQVNSGMFASGVCRYIYGHSESNWTIHEQAREILPGEIVVIDGIDVQDRALFGELVAKYIILYKMAEGIVALGNLRDANDLIKQRYAVWCYGFNPIGCFNEQRDESDEVKLIVKEHKDYYDGAIAICDDTGVTIIPKDKITDDFFERLDYIEKQEDIWFNCIDFRKWDTYDTVCLKKYLNEDETFIDLEK